jgi:hypothetical protein
MKYAAVLSLGALVALVGCKPPQTYEWGNYEGALYSLMKDPSSLDSYGKSLRRHVEDGQQSGKVPPGIYAEYGYFLTVTNQPAEAIKYYEKEKQRWPESARLMDKMILNCRAPRPNQVAPQPTTITPPPAAVPATGSVALPPAQAAAANPVPGKES